MNKQFSLRRAVAVLTIAMGAVTAAYAMPPQGEMPGPVPGMHGPSMWHGLKALARLHDELKLDAKQEALWKEAEAAAREDMVGVRDRFRQHHEQMRALLDQPGADMHEFVKRMDDFRAEGQKRHVAMRDRWLAVYDTLSAGQKEKVRLFFKAQSERMDAWRARQSAHGRGNVPGQPPMPPAPPVPPAGS